MFFSLFVFSQEKKINFEEVISQATCLIFTDKKTYTTGTLCSLENGKAFILTCAHTFINHAKITSIYFPKKNVIIYPEYITNIDSLIEKESLSYSEDYARIFLDGPISEIKPFLLKFKNKKIKKNEVHKGFVFGFGCNILKKKVHMLSQYFIPVEAIELVENNHQLQKRSIELQQNTIFPELFQRLQVFLCSITQQKFYCDYLKPNILSSEAITPGFSGSIIIDQDGYFFGVLSHLDTKDYDGTKTLYYCYSQNMKYPSFYGKMNLESFS